MAPILIITLSPEPSRSRISVLRRSQLRCGSTSGLLITFRQHFWTLFTGVLSMPEAPSPKHMTTVLRSDTYVRAPLLRVFCSTPQPIPNRRAPGRSHSATQKLHKLCLLTAPKKGATIAKVSLCSYCLISNQHVNEINLKIGAGNIVDCVLR